MDWQAILTYSIVAAAAVVVVKRFIKIFDKNSPACPDCSTECGMTDEEEQR